MQAATAAESAWVLDAMAWHRHVAPCTRPREPWPLRALPPVLLPREVREIVAVPVLARAQQAMLQTYYLHLHQWRMAGCLDARSTATRKLAVASLCWQHIHSLRSFDIQAKEVCGRQHLSQVHAVTSMAVQQKKKVPTRTGPCCTPSTISCHSDGLASHQVLHDPALSCTISHKK